MAGPQHRRGRRPRGARRRRAGSRLSALSFDPGSSNERTALAWQRTALSILAGAALRSRLTLHRLGWAALAVLLVSGPLALWVFWEARGRYAHDARLRTRPRDRGGRAPFALAAATVVLAVAELAALSAA